MDEENAKRKQKKMKVIDCNEFELAIDRLEKETFFKVCFICYILTAHFIMYYYICEQGAKVCSLLRIRLYPSIKLDLSPVEY